jgi:ADP-heptose:LPS heptosyltransferase
VAVATSIVALRPLGLGDFCTGVPALKALRRAFPADRLVLAAPAWQGGLAAALVDEVVDAKESGPLSRRLHGAGLAVNLHGRGPQSTRRLMATAPCRLLAFRHDEVPATRRSPRWRAGEHEVHRWCRLLAEGLGIAVAPNALDLPLPRVATPLGGAPVVVHPGASASSRQWPTCRFASVVRRLADRGHDVALTGSRSELALCRAVAAASGHSAAVLAGRTSVEELAATVAGATAVISGDTGIAHLATAYRTPSVVLFGPVPPSSWGPPARPWHRALWTGRPGDEGDPHGTPLDPRLAAITVDEVLDAFEAVTAGGSR